MIEVIAGIHEGMPTENDAVVSRDSGQAGDDVFAFAVQVHGERPFVRIITLHSQQARVRSTARWGKGDGEIGAFPQGDNHSGGKIHTEGRVV